VKDTGAGISEENQKKLFKLFGFINDTRDKNVNGIGLGLMISQQLVKQYDGKIDVNSKLGEGSNFYIILKLGKPKLEEQITSRAIN
jgi:signal transduction histidine kinase